MAEEQTTAPEATTVADQAAPASEAPNTEEALDSVLDEVFGPDTDRSIWDDDPEPEKASKEPGEDDGQLRDEQGRFAKKDGDEDGEKVEAKDAEEDGESADDAEVEDDAESSKEEQQDVEPAPSGINAEAWAKAPPELRADISRRFSEMEGGIQQYQQAFAPLREYADLAQKAGKDLPTLLQQYRDAEVAFYQRPADAVRSLAKMTGFDVEDVALQLLEDGGFEQPQSGPPPEVTQLQQQVQQLTNYIQQREQTTAAQAAQAQVEAFQASAPRFDELRPVMARLIQTGMVDTNQSDDAQLREAYEMAERLKPAPASTPAQPAPQPQPQSQAHTPRAANKSVSGAPGSGSNPNTRRPAKDLGVAVEDAFTAAGL